MTLLEETRNQPSTVCGSQLDCCNSNMRIASVAGQRASFASGHFIQSMYQDNTLVKCQIELVRYDKNASSNLMWQWVARTNFFSIPAAGPGRNNFADLACCVAAHQRQERPLPSFVCNPKRIAILLCGIKWVKNVILHCQARK